MKIVLIRPQQDFGSIEEMIALASGEKSDASHLNNAYAPLLPVIVGEDGLPVGAPNQFLAHTALRSKSVTGDTARTYAEALVTWLKFISKQKFKLEEATEERLALFRNYLFNFPAADGRRKYSPATVNNRIAVAESFYLWCYKTELMYTSLGKFLYSRASLGAGRRWGEIHARSRTSDSLRVGHIQRIPRVFSAEELERFFSVARPPFKLMFRWCVATGLRRFEVCTLRKSALATAAQIAARGMELVPIDITRKGGKTTTVYAPAALVEETHWYCLTERCRDTAQSYGDFVFLNPQGRPYTRGSISRAFRHCADQIESDATLHHLRHTFATLVLGILESLEHRNRPMNSIKTVQILLGHSNVTTTEIYLRALEVSSDEVRNALEFLYGATL